MLRSLRGHLDAINTRLDPIRYYLFRPFRVCLFYRAFITAFDAGTANIPGSDPEMYDYNPSQFHPIAAISLIFIFILVLGSFVLYDPSARRRFCQNKPAETHLFSEEVGVLRSYTFWCDTIGLIILPLIFQNDLYRHILYIYFHRENFTAVESYFWYLLTIFPFLFLIEFIIHVRTKRFWRSLTSEQANDKSFDFLKILLLWTMTVFGFGILTIYLGLFLMVLQILRFFPIPILALALFLFTVKRFRAFHLRRKFLKKLKKVCKEGNFELSKVNHPYISLFKKDYKYHFTVKAYGKTYACKMLAAISKDAPMVFLDETMGYFKNGIKLKNSEFTFRKVKFYHGFEAKNADHKVLIVSPAPRTMLAIDSKIAFASEKVTWIKEGNQLKYIDNATNIFGMTIFSGSAFLNALERNCLHVKPE